MKRSVKDAMSLILLQRRSYSIGKRLALEGASVSCVNIINELHCRTRWWSLTPLGNAASSRSGVWGKAKVLKTDQPPPGERKQNLSVDETAKRLHDSSSDGDTFCPQLLHLAEKKQLLLSSKIAAKQGYYK